MRLSIVALALATVAALPVPKAGFLRGARDDEDTSSTHREGGRHVSFGRYAQTPTPAPTYWASAVVGQAPPLSALPQDSQACQDAVASIDEIPSCDDVGLNNQGLCKADPATTACSLPAGDSCVVNGGGDDPQRRLQAGSTVVSSVGNKGGVDAFYCFASYLGLANPGTCANCCGGCTAKTLADAAAVGYDFSTDPSLAAGECVCFDLQSSGALSGQVVTLTNSNDCAVVTGNNLEIRGMEGIDAILVTGDGNDLKGHTGDDVLYASGEANWLYGEAGDDMLGVEGNYNYLQGWDGDDRLFAYGNDNQLGGDCEVGGMIQLCPVSPVGSNVTAKLNDVLYAQGDRNKLFGHAGNDDLTATGDDNELKGNEGADKLTATGSVLVLDGGPLNYGLDIDSCTLNGAPQTYDLLGPYQPIGNGCGD